MIVKLGFSVDFCVNFTILYGVQSNDFVQLLLVSRICLKMRTVLIKHRLIALLCLFITFPIWAQNDVASLKQQLETAPLEKKAAILNQLAKLTLGTDNAQTLVYAEQALSYSEQTNNVPEQGNAIRYMADAYNKMSKYDEAIAQYEKLMEVYRQNNIITGIGRTEESLAIIYTKQGKKTEAKKMFKRAYNTYAQSNDEASQAYIAFYYAGFFAQLKEHSNAIEWYKKARTHAVHLGNPDKEIVALDNIGSSYGNWGDYEKSLTFLQLALKKAKEHGKQQQIKLIEEKIAIVNENIQNELDSKTDFALQSERERESYIRNIEDIQVKTLSEIEKLNVEAQNTQLKLRVQKDEYEKQKLLTKEKEKEIELKTTQLALREADLARERAEKERKTIQLYGLLIGIILVTALAFVVFLGYRNKRRSNRLLSLKNEKIEFQKDELEKRNRNITKSIDYATRIQAAILPATEGLKQLFSDSFVFFRPKDKVSGDFFWYYTKGELVYLAVVDCTGHGVPGAFMSIIGSNLMEKVIVEQGADYPAEILQALSEALVSKLQQNGAGDTVKDGMDMAIVVINKQTNELLFSGARNPLYIVRNKKLMEIKGAKISVGYNSPLIKTTFCQEKMTLQKGDSLYLFSDGFVDQKGGEKRKKFYYQPFKELLTQSSAVSMQEQVKQISQTFDDWKKNTEQIDDVLVLGVRI